MAGGPKMARAKARLVGLPREHDVESEGDDEESGVRADCLATNTEYCDRCTHAATQATNVARIKTEGTKGLLQGQVAG
jgi:hypothetical protein